MAEEQKPQQATTVAGVSQQLEEDCTGLMEEILEKLKLLNYEQEFMAKKGFMGKPLNRAYFAVPFNANEQFNYFKILVMWLFSLNEIQSQNYTKYDDPMSVASNIQYELKKLGIEADYPPMKLKSGSGDAVCSTLLQLINKALAKKKFQFKKPNLQSKALEDNPPIETEGDPNLELQEDEVVNDEELEENIGEVGGGALQAEQNEDIKVLESRIDEKQWFKECEKVKMQLQVKIKSDAKDWRNHIEQSKGFGDQIKKILPQARSQLERKAEDLSKILDSIVNREKNINVNMNDLGNEYKIKAEELKKYTTRHNQLHESIRDQSEQCQTLSEKQELLLSKVDEHGSNVTDSSPIMKIKDALKKLRMDIRQMDLRIGVLNHTVTQHKFKERKHNEGENNIQAELYDGNDMEEMDY